MEIVRTVTVSRDPSEVFAYLSDFTTTTEWDPGTIRTTLEAGTGGVGTRYRNISHFMGRTTELTYVVIEREEPTRLALRGENGSVVAHDTITVRPSSDGGAEVTYRAHFAFKGVARLIAPLTGPAFRRLGDEAVIGLRAALNTVRP